MDSISAPVRDCTAAVLAGGKSSRFGSNKALAQVGGIPVIQRIVDELKTLFDRIIIITNNPGDYRFLNLPCFPDVYRDRGPLGGIHAALKASFTARTLIVPCDMPFFSYRMAAAMCAGNNSAGLLYNAESRRYEPLPAMVLKKNIDVITKQLRGKDLSLRNMVCDKGTRCTGNLPDTVFFNDQLCNLNTPDNRCFQ